MREPGGGPIPIIGMHRNVGLHNEQGPKRLAVVRAEIDHVLDHLADDARKLFDFAADERHAPEARLLSEALLETMHSMASEARAPKPQIDMEQLHAICAGLNSQAWRSPWRFGTLADRGGVPREQVLTDKLPPP